MRKQIVHINGIPIGIIQFDQNRELNAMGEIVSNSAARQKEKDNQLLLESLQDFVDKKSTEIK